MPECKLCNSIKKGDLKKIYEDDKLIVALCPEPISGGHMWVIPKAHYTIIEQIPDFEVGHLFNITNKISISLFEVLQAQGTNIFIENGVAAGQKYSHFLINIIPRMPNDGINLEWQPKQLTEEEMSTVELKVKDDIKTVGYFEEEKQTPIEVKEETQVLSDEEDYLIKSLRRIP
jgi:histidine triad (HIT) family protein